MEDWLEFWSTDFQFGLKMRHSQINKIAGICKSICGKEIGGILTGYYTHNLDCAVVTMVSGPPSDSKSTRNRFYRGILGLQEMLDRLWEKERHYYLGEWHFHPDNEPSPSPDDILQMMKIAGAPKFHCPEPVLLLVGYNPSILLPSDCLRPYVFRECQCIQLYCCSRSEV
jgi:integrative and conjugative element protein (TIGR02256 family)